MNKRFAALVAAGVVLVTVGAGCSSTATVTVTPPVDMPGKAETITTPPPATADGVAMEKAGGDAMVAKPTADEPKTEDNSTKTEEKTAISADGAMEVKVKAEPVVEPKLVEPAKP